MRRSGLLKKFREDGRAEVQKFPERALKDLWMETFARNSKSARFQISRISDFQPRKIIHA